jgi:hypothetical protein
MQTPTFNVTEECITYLLIVIRLSRVDAHLFNNLVVLSTHSGKITTNQVNLFNRVVSKYEKQLAEHLLTSKYVISLPWACSIIESLPQYAEAHIWIKDGMIYLKSPFSREFLSALNSNPIHTMHWDRDKREYSLAFGTAALKSLIHIVKACYKQVNYCRIVTKLLAEVEQFKSIIYWTPTLVIRKEQLYVVGCNKAVMEAIEHIPLTTDLKSISALLQYGIFIDTEVYEFLLSIHDPQEVKFACNHDPTIEISELDKVIHWLKDYGCDAIHILPQTKFQRKKHHIWCSIEKTIIDLNIPILDSEEQLKLYTNPVIISVRSLLPTAKNPYKYYKLIKVMNTQPIDLHK